MQSFDNLHQMQVYSCAFEIKVVEASMAIKFPCSYSVEIKSSNNKNILATSKNKVNAINSIATFNEILRLEVDMLFNPKSKQFVKKQILMLLNLISTRKPDQQKLVGRVTIDLSQCINTTQYLQAQPYKLQFCSVNASISFSGKFLGKKISSTLPENYERDSFSDFQSFVAGVQRKQNSSFRQKSFQQPQKPAIETPWKSKVSQGFDRNKIIQESHNEDIESRVNALRTSHKVIVGSQSILKQYQIDQSPHQQTKSFLISDSSHSSLLKNINAPQNIVSPSGSSNPDILENKESTKIRLEKVSSGANLLQKSNLAGSQSANQYEQILRNSHVQQKKIWDEQKRLLQEQISRQKLQNSRLKQKNQSLQKKTYESEMRICTIEGKVQNSKREMMILQRQKDLEIKDLKSRIDRTAKQKAEKSQYLEQKQSQVRDYKQKVRLLQNQKKRSQQQINREHQTMNQKMEAALQRVMNSEQFVSKLQHQLQQKNETILLIQQKNLQLVKQCQSFKLKVENVKSLQQENVALRKQLLQNEKNLEKLQQRLKKEWEGEKNNLILKINSYDQLLKQKNQEMENKFLQIQGSFEKQIQSLKLRIVDLESEIEQQKMKQNSLYLQIDLRDKKIEKQSKQFSQKLMDTQQEDQQQLNQIISQNQFEINALMTKMSELEKANLQFEDQINKYKNKEHEVKQYESNLENQILLLNQKNEEKNIESQLLHKQIQDLKLHIEQMKAYEKGLEEQILSLHQNNNTSGKGNQQDFKIKRNDLQELLKQKNSQLENNKQYIISLETQILRLNDEQNVKLNDQGKVKQISKGVLDLENQLKATKLENNQLKQAQIQTKQYQLSLEQQILIMNDQITEFQKQKNNKLNVRSTSAQSVGLKILEKRINDLENEIKVKNQYEKQLQQKILAYHQNSEKLQDNKSKLKIAELEEVIKCLKQYQNGLEQKILLDHNQIEYNSESRLLAKKLKQKEDTIQHMKQYQQGLEQKILENHDQLMTEQVLKSSIKDLELKLKQQKQYQEGLEEKILNDHEIIDKLQTETGGLKDSNSKYINKEDTFRSHHDECARERTKLQRKIQSLQAQIINLINSKGSNDEAQFYLQIHKQLSDKNRYIEELQKALKSAEKELASLQQRLAKVIQEKEDPNKQKKYRNDKIKQNDEDNLKGFAYEAVIRVIEAHSDGSANQEKESLQEKKYAVRKDSVSNGKQIMSQPPSLQEDIEEISDDLSGKSSPRKNSIQDGRDRQIMNLDEEKMFKGNSLRLSKDKKSKGQSEQKCESYSSKIKILQQKISESENEKKKLREKIEMLEKSQKKDQKKQHEEVESKGDDESQIKKLKKTIEEYEQRIKLMKNKQIKIEQALRIIQDESNNMIDELTKKQKQCAELRNIIENLNKQMILQKNKLESQEQLERNDGKSIQQIQNILQEKSQEIVSLQQKLSIQSEQNKKFAQILSQMTEKQEKQKQNSQALSKSKQRVTQLENEVKSLNQQLMISKRLVVKLRQNRQGKTSTISNQQLPEENKKLKKRIQELQEQLFSYQSNENQKEIQIQDLKNENATLRQQVQKNKISPAKPEQEKKQDNLVEMKKQIQNLRHRVESSQNQHMKQMQEKQKKIKNFQSEINKLQSLMKTQRLQYFNKRRQINQEKDQLQKKNHQSAEIIRQKTFELNELKQIYSQSQQKLTETLKKFDELKIFQATKVENGENIWHLQQTLKQKQQQIFNKNVQIRELQAKIESSNINTDKTQMLKQINYYSNEFVELSKRAEQVEQNRNQLKTQLITAEKLIEQLNSELQLCQQQNQFKKGSEDSEKFKEKQTENLHLRIKMEQIIEQYRLSRQRNLVVERQYEERLARLQKQLKLSQSEKQKAIQELEQKQMEHMNTQLDLQFKLREKNEKSQLAIGCSITDNQLKKSLNGSQDVTSNDLIPASKILKDIIANRSNRGLAQKQIQVMVIRISQLEEQLFGAASTTKEKGMILEKTRLLSMEFSKYKVNIMKSKVSSQERIKLLTSLRPFENIIKDILKLSELFSENLLSSDLTGENSRG